MICTESMILNSSMVTVRLFRAVPLPFLDWPMMCFQLLKTSRDLIVRVVERVALHLRRRKRNRLHQMFLHLPTYPNPGHCAIALALLLENHCCNFPLLLHRHSHRNQLFDMADPDWLS